jgi:hypothetical protein
MFHHFHCICPLESEAALRELAQAGLEEEDDDAGSVEPDEGGLDDDDDVPMAKLARRKQSGTPASRSKVRPEEAAVFLQIQISIAWPLLTIDLSSSSQGSTGARSVGLSDYDRKPTAVGRAAGYG